MPATSTTMTPTPTFARERVVSARTAVFVVFALAGLVFASWASRIADTKAALGLTAGELGLTLFAASVGSVFTGSWATTTAEHNNAAVMVDRDFHAFMGTPLESVS